jgi:hypothetical protein
MAGLEKMTIIAYDDYNFRGNGGKRVKVLVNPDKYSHSYKICYSKIQAAGTMGEAQKFNRAPADTVNFELVFDGTGVIGNKTLSLIPGNTPSVDKQIEDFWDVVFKFNPKMHSPNFVQLSWGSLVFNGRLSNLDINYTLFQPDGSPLRARATAAFVRYESAESMARKLKKKSPDLTHIIKVKEGDTLPSLCYQTYGDSSYYIQVAKKNNLTDFRNLVPDTNLIFPPVKK